MPEIGAAHAFITVMGGVLFAVALAIYILPVGRCDQCSHCRSQQVRERAAVAVEFCPLCRKQHPPGAGDHDR